LTPESGKGIKAGFAADGKFTGVRTGNLKN
jgi:hypothetical protein